MSRDSRSKPTNVVKSRSAPSLLGGFAAARTKEHLPTNRFIELGDIALGNSKRHETHLALEVTAPKPEFVEEAESTETPALHPKPPRLTLPKPRPPKPPKQIASSPLTRPKPPKPPTSRPKLPLPPKTRLPKLPKIERPKPFAPGRNTPSGGSR